MAARVEPRCVDSLSLVSFDANQYSVPTEFAHHPVTVVASVDTVRIVAGDRVAATHRRCWGREQVFYDPVHYLAVLERKPGALDFAAPAGGVGAAGLLRRPAAAAGGRVRRAGDAAVHQGPAAAGVGEPRRADPGRRAGAGTGRRRRRRGAADPGAPPGAAGRGCSASTAGRT